MRSLALIALSFCFMHAARAQDDTADVEAVRRMVSLSEVVVRSDLNISRFLQRIKNDTSFYKAFRNLRVLGFTSLNDIRMQDKRGRTTASLQSKTRQLRRRGCRSMEVLEEKTTGDIRQNGAYNYYTAALYASLFFTQGTICGEHNIVKGIERNVSGKKGLEKHKEQLKMLFFNPGRKIPGIPFLGEKINIYDEPMSALYNFEVDMGQLHGRNCYVFRIAARPDLDETDRDRIVSPIFTGWLSITDLAKKFTVPVIR